MVKNERLVPKRRFREFQNAGAWKLCRLGDLMEVTSVKRIHQADWTTNGVRFLRARDIISALKSEEPDEYLYISEEKYNNYSQISGKVRNNDLLVTGVGTIGVPYLVKSEESLYFKDGNIIWFKNKNIYGNFLFYSFLGEKIKSFIRNTSGSGTVGTYTIESGRKTPISLPGKDEQIKVGYFFKQLDITITLYQRKIEKTKALKSAYLSEMFPAEGESKPKRRFAGFTDAWKRKRLGEVTKVYDGTHQTPKYTDNGIMFLSVENIKTLKSEKYISNEDFENEFNIRPEKGDVFMTRIGDIGTANVLKSDEAVAYYVSLALLKPEEVDSDFLTTSIATSFVKEGLWKRTLHIAFPKKINKNEINNVEIMVPSRSEQEKIGLFFKSYDNLITLQQRKLEKLQNIKQAYLNEMFI